MLARLGGVGGELDQRHDPGGHEPGGPDRGPGPGHLADLDDPAPVGDVDAAAGLGRGDLVGLGARTGIDHDLDTISLHGSLQTTGRSVKLRKGVGGKPGYGGQYDGSEGSTWVIQASTPPATCTASEEPGVLTMR